MTIQKLPWAGILAQDGTTTVAIDPIYHFPSHLGQSHETLYPLSEFGAVDAVLVTHHHGDHFDPQAIRDYYGRDIPVYLPEESVALAIEAGLENVHGAAPGQSFAIGTLRAFAAPSVDGTGDAQVAWIVEGGGRKLIHAGDTLWHGYWWKIAADYGPFDAACLPVNGAVLELPRMSPPSGQPICLTPEQAVSAAVVLGAKTLVPIHHTAVHFPPVYRQTPDMMNRLTTSAHGKIELSVLTTKSELIL
ncbi:MBL fold metallo-hydrolase [Cohnella sp. AR92]|nr:MBL fold metallo-hydrolase [Cohnella sp. AR92]